MHRSVNWVDAVYKEATREEGRKRKYRKGKNIKMKKNVLEKLILFGS
jgi:hypothetical protein